MENIWTKDQQRAIGSFGKGVTVSAAAGSGKTAVLIERVISLLTDKKKRIPADKLLAVTFTIDAAAQMRDKLSEAFEKKLREDPSDSWLLQQQELVGLARISTIDSFCFDLVKENLDKFSFRGGLKILGDAERELCFENAFGAALEELCSTDREGYGLLDSFFDIEKGELSQIVESLHTHLGAICHRESWCRRALENYEDQEVFGKIKERSFQFMERELKKLRALLEDARSCLNYSITAGEKSYELRRHVRTAEENFAAFEESLSGLELAVKHRDRLAAAKVKAPVYKALRLSGKMPEDVRGDLDLVRKLMGDDLKTIRERIAVLTEGLGLSDGHLKENLRLSGRIFRVILKLEKRTEELLYEIKLEKNAVDFSDIETMAKDLLVTETEEGFERTALAEEIRSMELYRLILIDEYQDVNDVQEMIFKAVSDTDDLGEMGRNTFIVGDMKQAIYGFRQTNPELFKRSIRAAGAKENSERLEHIRFRKNFRSRREVLGLSNFVFETVMSEGCGQVDYCGEERLEPGAVLTERSCPAEIMLVSGDEDSGRPFPEEFYQTALRIKEYINSKAPVCENGEDRPCRQSDFCILVNTNKNVKEAADALKAVGLQAYSEDTAGYIKSREISLALDILRIIDDPMNDIAMTAVMMSPVLNFTPDDMAAVRERCKNKNNRKLNHIFQVLSGAAREKGTNETYAHYVDMGSELLQQKCAEAFAFTESLRFCSMSMGLERLIRKIFEVSDLMALTSVYLDGAKKRANLRLLLQYAADYESSGGDGVSGFLRYTDSVSGSDKAFKNAVSVSSGGDSVSVKTYHKSKGLEYPYVFLCTLSQKIIRAESKNSRIKLHKDLGCAFGLEDKRLRVRRENLYYDYLSDIMDSELKSERMRLLYVGFTRAMEKLTVVCSCEKSGRTGSERILQGLRQAVRDSAQYDRIPARITQEQDSPLAWTVMALAKHRDRSALESWLGMPLDFVPVSRRSDEADISFYVCGSGSSVEELSAAEGEDQAPADPSLAVRLRERYKNSRRDPGGDLPAKLTVTEIVTAEKERDKAETELSFYPNLPRLSDELGKLTAAERGTLTHRFMELADYEKAYEDVEGELKRLTDRGFFTPEQAKGIYVESLKQFVKSELFDRMRKSSDLRREVKFLASVEDMKLTGELESFTGGEGFIQGIADCIFRENDGWVLIDYKTDDFREDDDAAKYATQLKLYKAAFELLYGERVKSSIIYSFRLSKGLYFDI